MTTEKIQLDNTILTTYRFYTAKGQRLAIFGSVIENDNGTSYLKVSVLKCSKEDEFEKEKAKQAYLLGAIIRFNDFQLSDKSFAQMTIFEEVSPEIYEVQIKEGNSAKYTFVKFCNENFYKVKREKAEVIKVTFVGGGKSKTLGFEPLNK